MPTSPCLCIRVYLNVSPLQCGCDVFFMMGSGHRLRQRDAAGNIRTLAGSGIRGYRDGPNKQAEFNHPYAVLPIGDTILVADAHNHAIREYSYTSNAVRTVAGLGKQEGEEEGIRGCRDSTLIAPDAGLNYPTGLALDPTAGSATVFVADRSNNCTE